MLVGGQGTVCKNTPKIFVGGLGSIYTHGEKYLWFWKIIHEYAKSFAEAFIRLLQGSRGSYKVPGGSLRFLQGS